MTILFTINYHATLSNWHLQIVFIYICNDFEKFTSAHYVARHQQSVEDKLKWDEIALISALQINDESMKASFPSLYLNIAKGYEDLQDFDQAIKNYHLAQSFIHFLPDDGYGQLVKNGITNGITRVTV